MESIIQGFLGIFIMVFATALGVGVLTAACDHRAAQQAMDDYCMRIENSYFDPDVIEECVDDAAANERTLTVQTNRREGEAHDSYGMASLTYEFKIPVIGFSSSRVLYSDLR